MYVDLTDNAAVSGAQACKSPGLGTCSAPPLRLAGYAGVWRRRSDTGRERPSLSTDGRVSGKLIIRNCWPCRTAPPDCCLRTRCRIGDDQIASAEWECFQRRGTAARVGDIRSVGP